MIRHLRALLLLALPALASCVVSDRLAEAHLLPEGPITVRTADATPIFFLATDATGAARLVVDGEESGPDLPKNEYFRFPLGEFGEGTHVVSVRVWDGAQRIESNEVEVTLELPAAAPR